MPQISQKDLYYVAVKAFLRDKEKLLITKDSFGDWDLPGGRIRVNEFKKPLKSVLDRKIREELGAKIRYSIKQQPIVLMRHERQEANLGNQKVRIFAIGYEAIYKNGDIELGDHHEKMLWVDVKTFKPEQFFTGGWLKGVREYLLKAKHARTT